LVIKSRIRIITWTVSPQKSAHGLQVRANGEEGVAGTAVVGSIDIKFEAKTTYIPDNE
tara:strand:- start:1613 stop:1786 length:174 start_codon:yes stop_codon:yes gene_type:complete